MVYCLMINYEWFIVQSDCTTLTIFFPVVMELVKGGELFEQLLKKGSFSEKEAAFVMYDIFAALDYLHSLGIAHRDLKPQNVLCEMEGENIKCVKLMDFGLSSLAVEDGMQSVVGTPLYVAPEQVSASMLFRSLLFLL